MRNIMVLAVTMLACAQWVTAQDLNPVFSRLRAISNSGTDFYNIDGIEITSQLIEDGFSAKNIAKKFKKHSIRESDLVRADSSIAQSNFYVVKESEVAPGLVQRTSYYFVSLPGGTRAITFGSINKADTALERELVRLIITDSIPAALFEPMEINGVSFAGRQLPLGGNCRWMGVNNVQCPYYGQMNWSIHRTLEDATASVDNQFKVIQNKKQGKIISEEEVTVIFEGVEVKARRAVYDFKGVSSLLVGMSGGKTLTIYFVAAPVRGNFVSCVMSFWNNDIIKPSGLPQLLEEVMILKS